MISHRHKAVFVHIPKTAGQSVEKVFLDDLGLNWKQRDQLLLRRNMDPARGPKRLAHLLAREYVELGYLSDRKYAEYCSFAIVRHPFDRMISEYRYRLFGKRRRGEPLPDDIDSDFDRFMRQMPDDDYNDLPRHLMAQADYVLDRGGEVMVDHVLRFEDLDREIAPIFAQLFFAPRVLGQSNRSRGFEKLTRENLTAAQKSFLVERYRTDFELFSYSD